MKLFKRPITLALAAALLLFCLAGCKSKDGFPAEPAATQGDIETSAKDFYSYFSWVALNFETGLNQKYVDFADTVVEDAEVEGQTYRDLLVETTLSYSMYEQHLWSLFNGRGLALTDAHEAEIQQQIDYYKELSGSEEAYAQVLISNGLTVEFFENNLRFGVMTDALMEGLRGEEGLTDEDVMRVAQEEFVRVKHILLKTIDDNYEALPEEEIAAKAALKDELLQRLEQGADFDALMEEYGEDPGMQSNPEGYVIDQYVSFDPAFLEVSMALSVDEIQLAEGSYGYHIIKRYPLREQDLQAQYPGNSYSGESVTVDQTIFGELASPVLNDLIETFREENEIVKNEAVINQMIQRFVDNDTFEPEVDESGLEDVPDLDDLIPGEGEEAADQTTPTVGGETSDPNGDES